MHSNSCVPLDMRVCTGGIHFTVTVTLNLNSTARGRRSKELTLPSLCSRCFPLPLQTLCFLFSLFVRVISDTIRLFCYRVCNLSECRSVCVPGPGFRLFILYAHPFVNVIAGGLRWKGEGKYVGKAGKQKEGNMLKYILCKFDVM